MYLSTSKCWYSNNCLHFHFLKRAVSLLQFGLLIFNESSKASVVFVSICCFISISLLDTWGRIFSCVWPFYVWAVSDLGMHRSLWVLVAHSSFIEGSHTTKNTASDILFRFVNWKKSFIHSGRKHVFNKRKQRGVNVIKLLSSPPTIRENKLAWLSLTSRQA